MELGGLRRQVGDDLDGPPAHAQPLVLLAETRLHALQPGVGEVRQPPAQRHKAAVPCQHLGVGGLAHLIPPQLRAGEGLRRLRVGDLVGGPAEGGELAPPALADRRGQGGVPVVGEVEERRGGRPLLALEQHRDEGRRDHQGSAGNNIRIVNCKSQHGISDNDFEREYISHTVHPYDH